jgi:hypothetical protein
MRITPRRAVLWQCCTLVLVEAGSERLVCRFRYNVVAAREMNGRQVGRVALSRGPQRVIALNFPSVAVGRGTAAQRPPST